MRSLLERACPSNAQLWSAGNSWYSWAMCSDSRCRWNARFLFEQEIVGAAIDQEVAGMRPWSIRSTMANGSSDPPAGRFAEDPLELGLRSLQQLGISDARRDRPRVRVHAGKHFQDV